MKEKEEIFFIGEPSQEDLKLIRGCLLTTKETFKIMPIKNADIKNKIEQIDNLLLKFKSGT
ncbi:MAG: hypothetical protein HFJ23_08370 [Clostridia bacterium]|nr:hypothetical protein [Clostridia bacterium]